MSIKQDLEGLSKPNRERYIADLLGLPIEDLQKLNYDVEEDEDGIIITFDVEGSDPEILEQVEGLDNNYSIVLN